MSFVAPAEYSLTSIELAVSDFGDPYDERPGETPFDVGIYSNEPEGGIDKPGELLGSATATAPESHLCNPASDPDCLPFGYTRLTSLTAVNFSPPIPVSAGERYWIGLHPSDPEAKIDIAWWWNYLEEGVQSRGWTSGGGGTIDFERVALGGPWESSLIQIESAFRVNGVPAGFDCDYVTEIPTSECLALVGAYEGMNGDNWYYKGGWLTTLTPCSWDRVFCAGGHVQTLALQINGLSGSIPGALEGLTELEILYLNQNRLMGPIPKELGNLPRLKLLYLDRNQLSGPIPAQLGDLTALERLHLDANGLSGPIPEEMGNLENLWEMKLESNLLDGALPASLGDLTSLRYLYLQENQLSGPIPPELGDLSNLTTLHLHSNDLTGPIPSELAGLSSLNSMYIYNNALSGLVPLEVAMLGGALPLRNHCIWVPGNDDLYMPDTQAYREADPYVDGKICRLGFSTNTEMVTEDLEGEVEDLVSQAILNPGQSTSLTVKLDEAISRADKGQYRVAVNLARAFANQVESLVATGVLTPEEAAPLLERAEILIELWADMM